MPRNPITDFIDKQQWIGRLANLLAPVVRKAFTSAGTRGQQAKDFLHGVWLAHPLHPVLTDIPIGAWTTAVVFDIGDIVNSSDGLARAADAAVTVGLVGAVGSAVTGLTDWSETDGAARKVGLVHAAMNITATSLYVASLVTRRRGRRWTGRAYALAGYLVSAGAAYLGGELVYGEQSGVNHAFGQSAPPQFTPVLNERELKEGRPTRVQAGDVAVLLVRQGNRVHAMADTCAHLGGPLSEGTLGDGTISCPWHGSTYSLEDGSVVCGPTTFPQPSYECRLRGGQVEIRARREPAESESQVPARKVS